MTQSIKRKDFLALTLTFTTLGLAAACGDDDDDATNTGGTSGSGGKGGSASSTGGKAGNTSAGTANGGKSGSGTGGKAGNGTGGTTNEAGTGEGGVPEGGTGNEAGGGGVPEGGINAGGAGAGGEGGTPVLGPQCDGIALSQTASTAAHDHIPTNDGLKATFFAYVEAKINGASNETTFDLPELLGHHHTITLTEPEVTTLQNGGTVTRTSDPDATTHSHTIKIECA